MRGFCCYITEAHDAAARTCGGGPAVVDVPLAPSRFILPTKTKRKLAADYDCHNHSLYADSDNCLCHTKSNQTRNFKTILRILECYSVSLDY